MVEDAGVWAVVGTAGNYCAGCTERRVIIVEKLFCVEYHNRVVGCRSTGMTINKLKGPDPPV